MDFVSTDGIAVVLTPGRYNSAFFEHAYLAEKTGAALAFPEDLEVVDNKVYFLDYAGRKHRAAWSTAVCPTNISTRSRSTRIP